MPSEIDTGVLRPWSHRTYTVEGKEGVNMDSDIVGSALQETKPLETVGEKRTVV